ncbi:class II fructose-bisphosphate aldolase [Maledivibacter halophilus]|uniref:Fructose-bisphosphate aldolase n=1 Tax=Maledivibacter halophilus TaxID=36842 RepID=A0A1T5KJS6_9FIRM|nr:class II fructose-bisphosphate aldolase [Maledivibacter halophilus]SKC63568.1 fructose-bisphosphate aldolase [Maledivibacter halophilus]
MLVSSKELFKVARKGNFAIPATNFVDQNSIKAYIEVAEKLNLPIILGYAEVHKDLLSFDEALFLGKYYGERAKVPAVLHLDHGTTKELIIRAIDEGFKSVMIDASMLSFEDNVKKTKEIVDYAHLKGVVVEAEIGHVGNGEGYKSNDNSDSIYTTVEEAKKFADLTNVDSLAISIGTAHGAYKGKPVIDFDRLKEIRNAIDTPLVLHGGSSSGDDNLRRCASEGISKINIFTDLVTAAFNKSQSTKSSDYFELRNAQIEGMKECLEHYYGVFQTKEFK